MAETAARSALVSFNVEYLCCISGEKIVPGKKKGFRGTHLSKLGMLVWSIWGS